MTKILPVLALATLASACAARTSASTTSAVSRDALSRYAAGVPFEQIETEMKLDDGTARSLVHDALVDLNRRYYGRR